MNAQDLATLYRWMTDNEWEEGQPSNSGWTVSPTHDALERRFVRRDKIVGVRIANPLENVPTPGRGVFVQCVGQATRPRGGIIQWVEIDWTGVGLSELPKSSQPEVEWPGY